MKNKLHPLREKIFQIYKENNDSLPPFREIAKIIGVSSTNTVAYHVDNLKRHGYFSPGNFENGIVKLNLINLIGLESKAGVYVLLQNKKPFYVNETANIKKDIMKKIMDDDSKILKEIKDNIEAIEIAYHFIEDKKERGELKEYLLEYYPKHGITLLQSSVHVNVPR